MKYSLCFGGSVWELSIIPAFCQWCTYGFLEGKRAQNKLLEDTFICLVLLDLEEKPPKYFAI